MPTAITGAARETCRSPDWTVVPLPQPYRPAVRSWNNISSTDVSAVSASAIADPASTSRAAPPLLLRATSNTSPAAARPPMNATIPLT